MSMEKFQLTDKVAIVTGAGRGVGRGIVRTMAEAGTNVVCVARTQEQIDAAAQEVRAMGGKALALSVDVRNEDQLNDMVKKTMDEFGRVDILVNNAAGGNFPTLLRDLTVKNFESVFRGTLLNPFLCARAVSKVMMDQKSGNIINISSLAGTLGTKYIGAYGACKAGLNNLTQTLAWELADYNVRVNCLVLGTILTEATHDFFMSHKETYMSHQLIKRFGEPEDIGHFCVFLASEASSWISGEVYDINGGKRRFDEVPGGA